MDTVSPTQLFDVQFVLINSSCTWGSQLLLMSLNSFFRDSPNFGGNNALSKIPTIFLDIYKVQTPTSTSRCDTIITTEEFS